MSERGKSTLWFVLPALVAALAFALIALPSLDDAARDATQAEAIIALVIFASVGGAVVGCLTWGIRKVSTRSKTRG